MSRNGKILWALSLVAIVALLVLYVNERRTAKRQQDVTTAVRSEYEETREKAGNIEEMRAELAKIQAETANLREQLARAQNMVAVLEQSMDELSRQRAAEEIPRDDGSQEDASTPESPHGTPLLQMIDTIESGALAQMQAGQVLEMGYGKLLDELALDPGLDREVRAVLRAHTEDQYRTLFAAIRNGQELTPVEQQELREATRQRIRADLETILSEEDLGRFDAYDVETELTVRGVERQLATFAPGLTEANRGLARDVIVEELRAQANPAIGFMPAEAADQMAAQRRAYRNAESRLSERLDDEQLRHFRAFIDHQNAMVESLRRLMMDDEPDTEIEAQP